jgi:hypothetical protein
MRQVKEDATDAASGSIPLGSSMPEDVTFFTLAAAAS